MEEREKIIQVLTHAVEQGSKSKYYGVRFYRLHDSTVVEFERELKKELKEKKQLFKRLDEKSNTYIIILAVAKSALDKLKNGDFDKTSAELINLFLSLQSVFRNNLKFVEFKESDGNHINNNIPIEETDEEKEKRLKLLVKKHRQVKYLPEGVTAKVKRKKKQQEEEKQELFSGASELEF